jgi:hypothetical protein
MTDEKKYDLKTVVNMTAQIVEDLKNAKYITEALHKCIKVLPDDIKVSFGSLSLALCTLSVSAITAYAEHCKDPKEAEKFVKEKMFLMIEEELKNTKKQKVSSPLIVSPGNDTLN